MYGLVFDNTHSKQLSKTVTFVVMTFPTTTPPKSGQSTSFRQAMGRERTGSQSQCSRPSSANGDPSERAQANGAIAKPMPELQRKASRGVEWASNGSTTFYTGMLSKKRRKRNQGWARRFFSLDFTSSTLSYYRNRNSSALRGAIPLSLAAVGADETTRQISIDSGTEIWLLRAHDAEEFEGWREALEKASQRPIPTPPSSLTSDSPTAGPWDNVDLREWDEAESLFGKVAGITDSVRRLAKDTDPKYFTGAGTQDSPSETPEATEADGEDYFHALSPSPGRSRLPWRRKSSAQQSPVGMFRRSVSAQKLPSSSLSVPTPNQSANLTKQRSLDRQLSRPRSRGESDDVHDRCMALLRDLDAVVAEFSRLIADTRQRRAPPERPSAVSRQSVDSTFSQEFFDADEGRASIQRTRTQLLRIRGDSDAEELNPDRRKTITETSADDSDSESDLDEPSQVASSSNPSEPSVFPPKPKTLTPLPLPPVTRRTTIPPSTAQPPSLISFLRKNVGKDLSTISMPVTANEPVSLLQRQAEQLEYSHLLDSACTAPAGTGERLLYVTAFAISSLSANRAKERAIRKPFNPMLGETYELIHPSSGFRFLAEKISHRPVRVACQAESTHWSFIHSPSPSQKFWGKSAEITVDGRVRVRLHEGGECYSWTPATCFLRNVIAGEKYVEPVASMTVVEETSGRKAVMVFKSGGMFSGRSEDISVQVHDAHGEVLPLGMSGKWTSHLSLTNGKEIWRVGELVEGAGKRYGMTGFAATLNEITDVEAGGKALPPTDSRKRPDQQMYEEGDVDGAERMKAALEEAQRRRRKEMENAGKRWDPRWFEQVSADGNEEVWMLKGEREGRDYWHVREAVQGFKHGVWDGVREVFET